MLRVFDSKDKLFYEKGAIKQTKFLYFAFDVMHFLVTIKKPDSDYEFMFEIVPFNLNWAQDTK